MTEGAEHDLFGIPGWRVRKNAEELGGAREKLMSLYERAIGRQTGDVLIHDAMLEITAAGDVAAASEALRLYRGYCERYGVASFFAEPEWDS